METLISVLRSVRRETDDQRDHLDIFREFLAHLGRRTRRPVDETSLNDRRAAKR